MKLMHFRRVKQLGAGDVGLVDLVQLQVRGRQEGAAGRGGAGRGGAAGRGGGGGRWEWRPGRW